jgi:NAD(P)-dependent dehydrogenase (short-subunit alcohol dehydrogenase family)
VAAGDPVMRCVSGVRTSPGATAFTRSPLTQRITGSPAATQASQALHALGRLGEPEDVAAVMAWLLGPEATWVTGQCYGVDGGLGTVRAK